MDLGRRSNTMGVQVPNVSPTELYQVIVGASSQDVSLIQASSQRLKQLLDMFGAYDALQEIAARRELPLPIRQQAIIQFKNVVVQHWRSRKLLSDEHRANIRQRCLYFVDEEDETIAECNEVVVAKLARSDYPTSWPNLINDLVQAIDVNLQKRYISQQQDPTDTLRLRRSLKLFNGILKEIGSVKLPSGMKSMAQIVTQLRQLLYDYYSTMSVTFSAESITSETISSQVVHDNILLSHLVYKCLAKIAIWLWNKSGKLSKEEFDENIKWVQELFQSSMVQLKSLTELRKNIVLSLLQNNLMTNEPTCRTISILTRHLRVFGKFFRRLQQLSIEKFVALPMSGDLIMFYWTQVVDSANYPQNLITDSDEALFPVRFLVQGMVLFKENLSQWTPIRRNGMPNKNTLSQEFVENAVKLLVTRFMPLNTSDLESWMADPEEWVHLEDKENDQWEYEIRACSERVLVQLCNHFSNFVVPFITRTFEQVGPQPPIDLDAVVQKEALYCAVGRCAIRLKSSIQLESWLEGPFSREVNDTNPNYPIIKRRIAWLIGKWVSEACILPNNNVVWKILVHLLQQGTDTVVRLTAAAALRECIDVEGFDPSSFAPFLSSTVPQLIELIGEADTLESKRKIDESLNTIIEQSGQLIIPFMTVITAPIPQLWITADTDLLLKGSLLVTVTKLIEAAKEHSASLTGLVVPLVRESLLPKVAVQLDADGLNLWLAALHNINTIETPDGSPSLRELFPQNIELLATNLDLLGSIIGITESYFLLDAIQILRTHARDLFNAYVLAFNNKVAEVNAKQLLQSLGLLVQLAPADLWGESMHTSGLFSYLLKVLLAGEVDTLVLTEHIYLFSRILLSNRQMFLQLMAASSPVLNQNEVVLYDGLLDKWWEKFDNMSEPRHRKLTALGIAVLVSTAHQEVLKRLSGEIFNIWLDVFGELKEVEAQAALRDESDSGLASPNSLTRYWELDTAPDSYFHGAETGTSEYVRRQAVYERDPVRSTSLIAFVGAQLRDAEANCGPAAFQTYMSQADPAVLKQLQEALARG